MKLTTTQTQVLLYKITPQNPEAFLHAVQPCPLPWFSFLLPPQTMGQPRGKQDDMSGPVRRPPLFPPSLSGGPSGAQGSSFSPHAPRSLEGRLAGSGEAGDTVPLLGPAAWGWWRGQCHSAAFLKPRLISARSCCGHSISLLPSFKNELYQPPFSL